MTLTVNDCNGNSVVFTFICYRNFCYLPRFCVFNRELCCFSRTFCFLTGISAIFRTFGCFTGIFVILPMHEKTRTGVCPPWTNFTDSLKLPFSSVIVPVVVPLTITAIPGAASPFSSVTCPVTVLIVPCRSCAGMLKGAAVRAAKKTEIRITVRPRFFRLVLILD